MFRLRSQSSTTVVNAVIACYHDLLRPPISSGPNLVPRLTLGVVAVGDLSFPSAASPPDRLSHLTRHSRASLRAT
jgi:hypothetical protein